jgi:O-antigen/teichoic acid export membrane protein
LSRSLSHQVGILTLGRLVSYAVMFIVPLVNVRTLSKEEYGYYRQFWLLFETLTPILILGFPRSLLYYLPRIESRDEKSAYLTQTVLFLTWGAMIAVLVYALMALTLGAGLGATARAFFWRLSFYTFFMMVTDYMEVLFVAQHRPVAQSVYHAAVWGLQALVVILVSYFTRDVSAVIWGLAFFAMARFLFGLGYTHTRYALSLRNVSWASMKEQASFAVPVGLAGIGFLLLTQTDKFIISRFLGREAFAVYSVGAFQLPLVGIIQTSIGNITFPLMAQYQKVRDYAAVLDLWRRSLLKTVIVFFPLFVFFTITAGPFIRILFTDEYADATPVFMVYMLLFLRSSVETGTIIQAFNRTKFLFLGFLIAFPINVGLGLLMLKLLGRIGVPLATLTTMTTLTVVNLWYAARLLGASLSDLFPTREVLKRFLAALAPGVALVALYQWRPVTNIYELAGAALVYGGIYALLCARTGLVTLDDLKGFLGRGAV